MLMVLACVCMEARQVSRSGCPIASCPVSTPRVASSLAKAEKWLTAVLVTST